METTKASSGFALAVSGMNNPPEVLSSASSLLTKTRSWSGRHLFLQAAWASLAHELAQPLNDGCRSLVDGEKAPAEQGEDGGT